MKKSTKSEKVVVAKGFVNAAKNCPHPTYNIIKSGIFQYLICRTCGKNMGEVKGDIQQSNS